MTNRSTTQSARSSVLNTLHIFLKTFSEKLTRLEVDTLLTQDNDADEVAEYAEAPGDDGKRAADDGDDVVIVGPLVILATRDVNDF